MLKIKKREQYIRPSNFILILIGLFLILLLIKNVGTKDIISTFASMNEEYLLIVFLLYLSTFLIGNLRLKLFVNEISKVNYIRLLPIYFTGVFVNNLTPGPSAGGEPVKAYFLSKMTLQDISKCLATSVMETASHGVTLIGFAIFSIAYSLLVLRVRTVSFFLEFSLVLLLIGIILLVYILKTKKHSKFKKKFGSFLRRIYGLKYMKRIRQKFLRFEDFEKAVSEKITIFKTTSKALLKNRKNLLKILLVSTVFLVSDYLKLWVIFIGLGYRVPFLSILVVVTIAKIISYFIFLPGGIGVVEITSAMMFTATGIPQTIATSAVLIDRTIFYIFSYAIGYGSLSYLNFKYRKGK